MYLDQPMTYPALRRWALHSTLSYIANIPMDTSHHISKSIYYISKSIKHMQNYIHELTTPYTNPPRLHRMCE